MFTPAQWIKLATKVVKVYRASSKIVKVSGAAKKNGKELKGKELMKSHLSVFENAKLADELKKVEAQLKQYEELNRRFDEWKDPDYTKYEKACRKAKQSGNDKAFFKHLHAFEGALHKQIDALRKAIPDLQKLKPLAKAAFDNHNRMTLACRELEAAFKLITKVAVLGPFQSKMGILYLQSRELTKAHNACRSECKRLMANIDRMIADSKASLRMAKDQEDFIGSQDFEESLE
ncbi:MAG: hypothetical protein AAGF60_07065 [Pseudomonadota bacterium]